MQFYATRDIAQGEALNFSYLPSDVRFEERRQTTAAEYCFSCECERCRAAVAVAGGQGGTGEHAGDATGKHTDGKAKAPLPAAVEPRLPRTVACPCGGWMYPWEGIRVCSICKQPADADADADAYDAAGGSSGGGASVSAESDEQASDSESEEGDNERLSSSGGEHLASSECYCGGWRFNNRDQWLCVHCDYAVRVSESPAR